MIGDKHDLDEIRQRYRRLRYMPLLGLLSDTEASRLASVIDELPFRRASLSSDEHASRKWDELHSTEAITLFASLPVLRLVLAALAQPYAQVENVWAWVNRYHLGEFIPRHTDSSGSIQLAICLRAPDPANGGTLWLAAVDGEQAFDLRAGDGLLFETTTIEHWTTPLIATENDPDPIRITAVGRYYV